MATACVLTVAAAAYATSAWAGGSSLSTAPLIVPGQQESGNTGTVPYTGSPGSCGPETGDYWKLALLAGDHVTIDWGSSANYVTGLDVWPPGTTDFNDNPAGRFTWDSIGANGQEQTMFTAKNSGIYPVVFDDSCGDPGPYEFTVTVVPDCMPATPVGKDLQLVPSSGTLPVDSTVTFTARAATAVVVGQPGKNVSFAVECGPNAIQKHEAVTDIRGNASFTDSDSGGAGTDALSASLVANSGATQRATASVTWASPAQCGAFDVSLGFATALRCLAAQPMVKTILQVGECSVGVATFFVPAAKLTRLFDLVKASKSVAFLNGPKTSEQPLARLLYDLYHAYGMEYDASAREGFRSFAELEGTFTHLSTAAELMRDLPNIWIAIRQADISEVALDVANLTGLKPCVELLAKAVAT